MTERELFEAAVELPPGNHAAFLDGACGGDGALRQRLDALLSKHDQAGSFLEKPVVTGAFPADAGPKDLVPQIECIGQVLAGRYKLLEAIGEGGMGTVWMAQQTEPVKRLVAVKLIKPGMDSRQVLARFGAERQALALMDHPHIAKVLDAGAAPDGRPFFVMELVKGVPITAYCDAHRLTPRQRLELFVPVCQAIQHAHHKGVIHRDLKPSNVLVALYDDRPVPKVIDFGVAKAAGLELTEETLHTGFGAVVGTVEYMSPEQASFNQLDVDTRSDVYSLGVLLYELLAGSPPFTREQVEKAGVLEMLRVIREQEPPKPSTKLSTAESLPALAANRGTEPKRLTALVRGELDWIVMKALEKDRSRRYETANSLAMDLQRYLNDEHVLACPPSAGYRLRKWAWRHRTVVWAAGLSVAAVLLAFAAVTWQWRVAVQALAEKELARKAEKEQREQAEANWAAGLIALADRDWVRGDLEQAQRSLEQCPLKYRNDEWRRLHLVCHAEIASVQIPLDVGGGGFIPHFSPDGRGFVIAGRNKVMWFEGDDYRSSMLCETPGSVWLASVVSWNRTQLALAFRKTTLRENENPNHRYEYWVGIWDPTAKRWLVDLTAGSGLSATLSSDGRLIAVAEAEEIKIREVGSGNVRYVLPIPKAGVLSFSPDTQWLAVVWQKGIRLWDLATGALVQEVPGQRSLDFSPDGQYLSFYTYPMPDKALTTVWSIRQGAVVANLDIRDLACKAFSPDNRFLAVGVSGGMIELWDIVQARCVVTFRGHTPAKVISTVRFSLNGEHLVSAGADGLIKVWNLRPVYEHLEQNNSR